MTEKTRRPRGPSAASLDAKQYLEKHPGETVTELMRRFKISHTTIYRADWWKNRKVR